MPEGLDLQKLPEYRFSAFRHFEEHERHIDRFCREDVLLLVFDGVLRFHEAGIPVEVKRGEYYIQRRGIWQQGVEESDTPQYYYIHFLGHFREGEQTLPLRGMAEQTLLFPLFRRLELLRISGAPKVELSTAFFEILSVLSQPAVQTERGMVVRAVLETVARDLRRPFSLEEAAARVGYCKNYIIQLFKEETGYTPYAYITHLRLDMARQLLCHSASTLNQISVECGFGNYINFYKAFIKEEGCSPLEWKRRLVGKSEL